MSKTEIREPIQKRSIEKKEKIIKAGFDLICEVGYHNTNTAKIAKEANVSTGIIYQYFKDKHDIFIAGLEKYANSIFYPIKDFHSGEFDKKNIPIMLKKMIAKYIKNHKLSKSTHEEIMAMVHTDKDVAYYYYQREMDMTKKVTDFLEQNGFDKTNIDEKVHIIIGMIDNLCHEVVYHKHNELDYNAMTDLVIKNITNMLK